MKAVRTKICSVARRMAVRSVVFLLVALLASNCFGYSVLSHEAIIDSAWDDAIKPLLLQRFPDATPDELRTAHGYAYGGAVIQDMGYYPFGSKFFSDLVHYLRSGDFIEALLRDSQDINDYAFALGALAHYAADNEGHRLGTNLAVPLLYPKLKRKYGNVITYDENPAAHLKTEFGFDVLQVAKGRYAPDDYRDHIGFQVAKPLLARSFEETYNLKLEDVFTNYDLAVGTYRRGVSSVIPSMTKVAWQVKKDEIQKDEPGITRDKFLYHLSRSSYEKNWSKDYRKPGLGTMILAFLFRLIPKIGPFSAFSFRTPTPETEKLFMGSFNLALQNYEGLLRDEKTQGSVNLANDNFDTGSVTKPGEYPLADITYANFVDRLARNHFAQVTPELQSALLGYYTDGSAAHDLSLKKKERGKLAQEVGELKSIHLAQNLP